MAQDFDEVDLKELSELLHSVQNIRFGIGIHSAGLYQDSLEEREKIAKSILENGIKLGHGYHSILGNVQSLGKNFDISSSGILRFLLDDIEKRAGIEHSGKECKVIVAVPTILEGDRENPQSSKIALGFPDRSIHSGSKAYEVTSFIDAACENMGRIPKEFVLGYLIDGKDKIMMNPSFYALLDAEKQEELFDRVSRAMGALRETSDRLLAQGKNDKDKIIDSLERNGFQQPEKLVTSIIEENARMNHNGMNEIKTTERSAIDKKEIGQSKEDFERKLGAFYDATHRRGLIFRRFDIGYAKQNRQTIEDIYSSMNKQDLLQIDDNNAGSCKRTIDAIKKLPKELRIDTVLKDRLMIDLRGQSKERDTASEASKRASFIITDEKRDYNQRLQEQFEKSIAAYMLLGGKDIYGEFHEVIGKMNAHGIKANAGLAVIHFGEKLAENMEGIQQTSPRNGQAWNLLLEQVLHAYTVSKVIENEKHNGKAQQEFEDKLVKLGLIERARNNQVLVPATNNLRMRIINRFHSRGAKDDKDKMKQPIMLEQAQVQQAKNEYINTGVVPIGFKRDKNTGEIAKETDIDRMRRESRNDANQKEQKRRMEEKQQVSQGQRIMVGIQDKVPVQSKQQVQNRQSEKTEQKLYER